MRIFGEKSGDGRKWRRYQAQYRQILYGVGEEQESGAGKRKRSGVTARSAAKVERQEGHLGFAQVLRVRVRYFSDSVAFGSEAFVKEVFKRNRERMRVKRETGARKPKQAGLGAWRGLVDLRQTTPTK